jgi:hypothetical protein
MRFVLEVDLELYDSGYADSGYAPVGEWRVEG